MSQPQILAGIQGLLLRGAPQSILQGDLQAPVPSLVLHARPFHEALLTTQPRPTPQPQGPVLRQLPPPVGL